MPSKNFKFGGDLSIKILHFWPLLWMRMDKKTFSFRGSLPHQDLCPIRDSIYGHILCSVYYIGCWYASASTSRLPPWSISRCQKFAIALSWQLSSYCRCSWVMDMLYKAGHVSLHGPTGAFASASPGLWNSLPSQLRDVDLSYSGFRWSLDMFVWIVGPQRSVNHFNCAV